MSQLHFHPMHGAHVDLSSDGLTAHHLPHHWGGGLVFSAHPVRVNQKIAVKFHRLSNAICFGFTSQDPNRLRDDLQSSYTDLLTRSDYWIWPLFRNMCVEGTVLFYYVTGEGEVHFGIDGREKDAFYKKVNVQVPLWAVFDIDGHDTTIQMVPPPESHLVLEPEPSVEIYKVEEVVEKIDEEDLCVLCYHKEINSVLYKCGHMCMCFECAMRQKHGAGNGQCPFCRADIKDVIRTYK